MKKYYFRYFSLGQWGFSIAELLVYSGLSLLIFLGAAQFLLNTNKGVTSNKNRVLFTQWSQEIVENLITEPKCVSPSCTSITSSCTNTIAGFDNTSDGETDYTALYSATKDDLSASKLYVNSSDPDYDSSKHTYSGLQIAKITVIGGNRDQQNAILRISFQTGLGTDLVSYTDLSVYIHEYESDITTSDDYSKIKSCSIVGTFIQGLESHLCYTLDNSDDSVDINEGRALVGCGGTHQIQKSQTTAFGYAAGKYNTGAGNTFIGYSAGVSNTIGMENIFVGYEAGKSSSTADNNTFIGYRAAYNNQASNNTFIGHSAGFSNTGGENNTFIGYKAAYNNQASNNTYIGHSAGFSNTTGNDNTFIGNDSGLNIKSGSDNVFVGNSTGGSAGGSVLNATASYNTLLGYEAGSQLETGVYNVLLGTFAGHTITSGAYNIFAGDSAGKLSGEYVKGNTLLGQRTGYRIGSTGSGGEYNVMAGHSTGGKSTTGSYNIFIGSVAGKSSTTGQNNTYIGRNIDGDSTIGMSVTADNQFNIGNLIAGKLPTSGSDDPPLSDLASNTGVIIHGKLIIEGALIFKGALYDDSGDSSNCLQQCTPSSRVYKKNIQPFIDYASALKDIESTSLFYYEYKQDHPDKKRMGVISEELPEHLQIRDKGVPSKPDWVSIYGTLWAGIKALSLNLNLLKAELFQLVKKTRMELVQQWESQQTVFRKQFTELKASLSQWREEWSKEWNEKWKVYELQTEERFQQSQNEVQVLNQELKHIEGLLKRNKTSIKKFHSISKKLQGAKEKLVESQNTLQRTQGSLERSNDRLKKLEEQIK